jgi:Holliday junction resolvasome RuvABC endonuclease subunit
VKYLGVDGGIRSGGLAVVEIVDGRAPILVAAVDIPTVGLKAKEKVDAIAVQEFLLQHGPAHAYLERAQAMPKQGASSGFKYGYAVGAIEAVIVCCGVALTIVEPTAWKKFHHLRGADKEGETASAATLSCCPQHVGPAQGSRAGRGRAHCLLRRPLSPRSEPMPVVPLVATAESAS